MLCIVLRATDSVSYQSHTVSFDHDRVGLFNVILYYMNHEFISIIQYNIT